MEKITPSSASFVMRPKSVPALLRGGFIHPSLSKTLPPVDRGTHLAVLIHGWVCIWWIQPSRESGPSPSHTDCTLVLSRGIFSDIYEWASSIKIRKMQTTFFKSKFMWPSDLKIWSKVAAFQLGYLDLGPPLITFIIFSLYRACSRNLRESF